MRKSNEDKKLIIAKIIELLEKNSRIRNKDIAHKLGISEKSVRNYIDELVNTGEIQKFTIVRSAAHSIEAFVNINVLKGTSTSQLCRQMIEQKLCEHAAEVSGEYDIISRIGAESIDNINRKIDALRSQKGIEKTRSFIVLRKWD